MRATRAPYDLWRIAQTCWHLQLEHQNFCISTFKTVMRLFQVLDAHMLSRQCRCLDAHVLCRKGCLVSANLPPYGGSGMQIMAWSAAATSLVL